MFVVEIGAVITTVAWLIQVFGGESLGGGHEPAWFTFSITIWLWLTVVFANLAEALAEGRGRAQAASLRAMRTEATAKMRDGDREVGRRAGPRRRRRGRGRRGRSPATAPWSRGSPRSTSRRSPASRRPVIREAGGDRSAVTGGTKVLSDRIVVEITQEPGGSFLDRMIALVEGAERRKTPNEIALGILLAALTLIFMLVIVSLRPFALFAGTELSETTLIALLVALIPTTIGALLSAIGIAGMDRLVRRNVLALSGRAVEASGDCDVLLLDKTGTITLGNREAIEFIPMPGVSEQELAEAAQMSSLADETPEGRSIVVLAKKVQTSASTTSPARNRPSSRSPRETRMSGVDFDGTQLRKGAGDSIAESWIVARGRPRAARAARSSSTGSAARAARRWRSPATSGCSASSTSKTSSRKG